MRTGFTLGAAVMTAAVTVISAGASGAAVARHRQPAGSPARSAGTNAHLVSGVVRDLSGRALGGVCVLASGADGMLRMARTSANGRYLMSLQRAGMYLVQYRQCQPGKAAVPDVAPAVARHIDVGASPITALPVTALPVTALPVTALPVTTLRSARRTGGGTFRYTEGGPVGRAPGTPESPAAGGMTGRVTGPAGRPLAGICVLVVGTSFAVGTETARNGTYQFGAGEFPPGSYPVVFTSSCRSTEDPFVPIAPGPWAPEWYKGEFARSRANLVQLRAGKVTRGINAVMRHSARIGGVVTGSDGRPVKNACALAFASQNLVVGQATTNSSGAYKITGLDPGSYRVLVEPGCLGPSRYGQAWYPRASTFAAAGKVVARFGHLTSGINVVVPIGGTISGVIRLGGKTGKPLGGICIGVGTSKEIIDFSDAVSRPDGTYSVEGLSPGNYQVLAQAGCGNNGNYAPASYPRQVRVANGKVTSGIDLFLQPGGTLSGTVTDAATAKPLGGICVFDDNGFAVTSAAGTYTIDQLPAERTAVGFAGGCGNKGSVAPQFYDDQATPEGAQPVTVTAGHVTAGINAAMLPGATFTGRVTNPAGRPVPGVCIGIVPENLTGFDGLFGGDAVTTRSGSYEVANFAPGDYAVAFFSGCLGPSNVAALQWFKGRPSEETAGMVDARAGTDPGIDAVVSRGGGIAGTVTGTTAQAVEFGCVTAVNRRTGQPSGSQSLIGGSYTISSLAPGNYTVIATDCDAGGNLAQSVYQRPVTVRAGRTTGKIALKLPPGGVVTGRITTARNGRAVPNACVEATPVSAALAGLGIGNGALTSGSGTYRLNALRTGSYRIETFPNCTGTAVNLRTVTLRRSVRVTQGKVTAGVNAALAAGGSIAGQVSGPGAAAVPGACVAAHPIPGGPAETALTDADGKYVVPGLTPGRYKVEFGNPSCSDGETGLGTQWYNGAAGGGSATVITVTAGRTVNAVNASLPADGTITGSVTGTSMSPLGGVCVSAVPLAKGEPASLTVSVRGAYTLADLLPGRYRVEFQAGCGQVGVKTQWWQGAASRAAAKIITVIAGGTVSGIDARMAGG